MQEEAMKIMIQQPNLRDQETDTALVQKATKLLIRMKRLKPLAELRDVQGVGFGRGVQAVKSIETPVKLTIGNRKRAVVMSARQYEEIVAIVKTCPELVEKAREADLMRVTDSHDALYSRITASRSGADALFSASIDEINGSYRPGATESL